MADGTVGRARSFDVVSLVLGLLLLSGAGLFLVRDLTDADVDLRWAGPVALVVAGVAGLLTALRGPGPAVEAAEPEQPTGR